MRAGIESNGALQLMAKMQNVADAQMKIARRAVGAGTGVMVKACRDASPGSVKNEVGRSIRVEGDVVTGKAGLMRFPKKGQSKGPHGVYLEHGTKFIAARHFIRDALASSRNAAAIAMEKSVQRSIETIVSSS